MSVENDIYNLELMDSIGRGYHNAYDFAKNFNVDVEEVIFALNNGTKVGNLETKVYKYADRRLYSDTLGRLLEPGERIPLSRWEIHNIDTGVFYKDGADAARKIGCTRAMVSLCLSGKRKTCRGFHLERVVENR